MLIDVVQYETCNHLKYSSILLVKLRILARTENTHQYKFNFIAKPMGDT